MSIVVNRPVLGVLEPIFPVNVFSEDTTTSKVGIVVLFETVPSPKPNRTVANIDPEFEVVNASSYVLSPIGKDYSQRVKQMVLNGKKAVESVCDRGVQQAMNSFN